MNYPWPQRTWETERPVVKLAVVQSDRASGGSIPLPGDVDLVFSASGLPEAQHLADLGHVVVLRGDDAIDPVALGALASHPPAALVLMPGSESDLQAEGVLELALALSESLAGLVVVVEDDGADPGAPGHGGSAIVLLGEVLAEALGGADVAVGDVPLPVPQPAPRNPLPEVPPILLQRLANHRGLRPRQDYPSDA